MTEAEWLTADGPDPRQLQVVHRFASVRKLLLLTAAYVRGAEDRPEYADAMKCADVIEAAADHLRPWDDLAAELASRPGNWAFAHALSPRREDPFEVAKGLLALTAGCRSDAARTPAELVQLLHEVVGNPFRRVELPPEWRTSTAVGLAEAIYEERAFDRLPILADALEEAGCDRPDVLAHCRGDGPHVRGCWVVDLVLRKT